MLTVDVHVHRDFWSAAARQAAAEACRRKAHAAAGRSAARAAYGRKDGAARLSKAAEAHAELHGEEHGKTFTEAAAAHTKRIAQCRAALRGVAKRTRKMGGRLLSSMMQTNEETRLY